MQHPITSAQNKAKNRVTAENTKGAIVRSRCSRLGAWLVLAVLLFASLAQASSHLFVISNSGRFPQDNIELEVGQFVNYPDHYDLLVGGASLGDVLQTTLSVLNSGPDWLTVVHTSHQELNFEGAPTTENLGQNIFTLLIDTPGGSRPNYC